MASIKCNENRKWVVDYRFGGKRRRVQFPTKQIAQLFLKDLRLKQIDNEYGVTPIKKINLKTAINDYYEMVSIKKAKRTQQLEKYAFEKLFNFLDDIPVIQIQLRDLEKFQMFLKDKDSLTGASVNRLFNIYRNFFSKCEDWDYIKASPTRKLKNYSVRATPKKLWSNDDIERVYLSCSPWLKDVLFLLSLTGMRMGEVCSLTWQKVDFDKRLLSVSSIKGTGEERVRFIPLTEELINYFTLKREEAKKLFRYREDKCIFLNAGKLPVSSGHVSRELGRLINKLGLHGLQPKNLRHTFITHMVAQNQSLEKIKQLAGHSSLKTTEMYMHLQDHDLRDAMEKATETRKILTFHRGTGTNGH